MRRSAAPVLAPGLVADEESDGEDAWGPAGAARMQRRVDAVIGTIDDRMAASASHPAVRAAAAAGVVSLRRSGSAGDLHRPKASAAAAMDGSCRELAAHVSAAVDRRAGARALSELVLTHKCSGGAPTTP